MPNELLLSNNSNTLVDEPIVKEEEKDLITTLKIEDDNTTLENINEYKNVLSNDKSSVEEKNEAFNALKLLNQMNSKEELLEEKIKNNYNLSAFVKIDGDKVRVVVSSDKHDNILANNIMNLIQEEFANKMYISVQFK
jgi:stage III sporulation protein AH